MRGKDCGVADMVLPVRITPAYAGKRFDNDIDKFISRDHPRVCGEKSAYMREAWRQQGSPPRMRGKEHNPVTYIHLLGITPAYAGKSLLNVDGAFCLEDHPRVCGEKLCIDLFVQDRLGSPPRMRGKDARSKSAHNSAGITPAYAGKSYAIWAERVDF